MPVTLESREDGHILYVKMTDPLDLRDMDAKYKEELAFRNTSNFTMHTVVDVSQLKKIPPSVLTVARRSPTLTHPRHGHLALVGAVAFLEALMGALQRIVRFSKIKFCKTEEEAMVYLRKVIADEAAKAATSKVGELPKSGPGESSIAP